MSHRSRSSVARVALLLLGPALAGTAESSPPGRLDEPAGPGVEIERAATDAEARAARARLESWRRLYQARLAPLRRESRQLFEQLEGSSLATLSDRCRDLARVAGGVDRTGLFRSTDVELDRILYGSLERYRAGGAECLARRYLRAYRLLVEARLGLEWVDRRIERRLRPRIPLRGLEPPR